MRSSRTSIAAAPELTAGRSVTITDVASAAGVSPMTVSRVLNDRGGASAETRARVLEVAGALNYRPNSFAKNLRVDRSKVVGIVVPDIANPFFPEIIRGAELAARPAGYTLLTCNVVEDPEREEEVIGTLLERRVDGVILCSARLEEKRLLRAIEGHRAVVLINRVLPRRIAGTIEIDYAAAVEALVEKLIAQGRRRFAFASGLSTSYGGQKRRSGLDRALARHGLGLVTEVSSSPDLAGGSAVGRALLAHRGAIDALVCYNDLIAIGAMSVMKGEGIAVPEEIAVTGCDDIPVAAFVSPALTTLRVAKQDLGELAMRMLLDRIDGRNTQHGILIEPDLMARGTTDFP
ncbi:LacI family DNA-binding transcriptional regulator [Chelatococcus asaccharovorans]|nr:LacI family DNA-binding transcriptional regulator [Chelatococcus asaccharovorans]MBS7706835.1 LacI family DNA-binding transcriptional regulator [Chelatococcus asaccharovorans]